MKGIRKVFRSLKRSVDSDVDAELDFHIATRIDALVAQGISRDAAERQAIREFGDVGDARRTLVAIDKRARSRRARGEWWNDVVQDVRVALRAYARRPGFTAAVVLTLAIAIGANAAIFSVTEAVLLRGLPYRDTDRLAHLWETQRDDPTQRTEASYPDFADWRALSDVFAAVEGYNETNVTVRRATDAVRAKGARVTAGFFGALGIQPIIGRGFNAAEDAADGTPVVILSHDYWRRELGGDRDVLGSSLHIDGVPYAVLGVLPATFSFAPVGDAELWFPLGGSVQRRQERFNHWVNVVARLQPAVTFDAARARLESLMQRLATQYPETNAGRGAVLLPLRDAVLGPVTPLLTVLFGGVTIVLLVACANVANLILARSVERADEIAVRSALGASRARVVRQLITENVVLASGGGLLGLLVATQLVNALLRFAPVSLLEQMPHVREAGINGTVLVFTLSLAALVGIVFGVAPAVALTRRASAHVLRGTRSAGGSLKSWLRDVLVASEIACTIVLVVGATLMARSVRELLRADTGFVAERVATARIALAGPRYSNDVTQQRFFEEVLAGLRTTPGVQAVGAVSSPPLQGGGTNTFRVEGAPEPPSSNRPEAIMRAVAGDYFAAMGIPLVEGRPLGARDDSTMPRVVLINQTLARRLFGNVAANGRRLRFYAFPESAWVVAGVVGDVKTSSLDAAVPPTVYYSHLQGAANRMTVMVKARSGAEERPLLDAIPAASRAIDPAIPVYDVSMLAERVGSSASVAARRYPLTLIGAFALAALVLAVIGVYGVIAYSVVQRRRELAVRMALGATGGDVVRLVVRRGVVLALIGVSVGVVAALLLSRSLSALLYGVTAADPSTYVAVTVLLACVVVASSYLPARRATTVDPALTLRSD